ncbi:hypothetical protein [Mucilaginibacter sp. 3215]|uniref:hypothetical protein n=1 Tax=Mucilaginibacter sp. 3215 TaxID=3373912 RepID=UPI003D1B6B8C
MATALLSIFEIPRWLTAVINITAYANNSVNLTGNDKNTLVLSDYLTHSLAINQFINSGRFKYRQPNQFFYEENFKLFFMHSCNPGIDKVQEATNRFSGR